MLFQFEISIYNKKYSTNVRIQTDVGTILMVFKAGRGLSYHKAGNGMVGQLILMHGNERFIITEKLLYRGNTMFNLPQPATGKLVTRAVLLTATDLLPPTVIMQLKLTILYATKESKV